MEARCFSAWLLADQATSLHTLCTPSVILKPVELISTLFFGAGGKGPRVDKPARLIIRQLFGFAILSYGTMALVRLLADQATSLHN